MQSKGVLIDGMLKAQSFIIMCIFFFLPSGEMYSSKLDSVVDSWIKSQNYHADVLVVYMIIDAGFRVNFFVELAWLVEP